MKLKNISWIALALVGFCEVSQANPFVNPAQRIGCATVTSVRDVNQAPLYNHEYVAKYGGQGGSADVASALVQGGVVGVVSAAVGTIAVDAARMATSQPKAQMVPQDARDWAYVKAVGLKMDDGSVMNLPLVNKAGGRASFEFREGNRFAVYWLKEYDSIQLSVWPAPPPDHKAYAQMCAKGADTEGYEAAVAAKANLINESKIIR